MYKSKFIIAFKDVHCFLFVKALEIYLKSLSFTHIQYVWFNTLLGMIFYNGMVHYTTPFPHSS